MFTLPMSVAAKSAAVTPPARKNASDLQTTLQQMQEYVAALATRIDADTSSMRQLDELVATLPAVISRGDPEEMAATQAQADEVWERVGMASPI